MCKNAALGEILFIISLYEKGRVKKANKFWSRKYIKSLHDSIVIMRTIISLIQKSQDISVGEMLPIFDFVNSNVGRIFKKNIDVTITSLDHLSIILHHDNIEYRNDKVLLNLMNSILCECNKTLENKSNDYKQRVIYLLMAFHNLPRAYLDTTQTTFFNIGIKGICDSDAIEEAYAYIKIMNRVVS